MMCACVRQCEGGRDVIEVAMKTADEDKKVTHTRIVFTYLRHNYMYLLHLVR